MRPTIEPDDDFLDEDDEPLEETNDSEEEPTIDTEEEEKEIDEDNEGSEHYISKAKINSCIRNNYCSKCDGTPHEPEGYCHCRCHDIA